MPLNMQFEGIGVHSPNPVLKHILKSEESEDYGRVLKVALVYAEEETVLIMPEIHESETEIRERLGIPTKKKNPDLKVGCKWIDVKSPLSFEKIVVNANKASLQGGIACITDDFIKINETSHLAKNILKSKDYAMDEVHFFVDGILYKYNSQGLIPG